MDTYLIRFPNSFFISLGDDPDGVRISTGFIRSHRVKTDCPPRWDNDDTTIEDALLFSAVLPRKQVGHLANFLNAWLNK